ncbi:MAG: right-handed parallel beta-helix repeat-containing protein [Candidatus Hodarchaeota archaeon]
MNKKVVFGIILLFCFIIGTLDPAVDLFVNNKANTFELSSSNDINNDLCNGLQIPFKLQNVPISVDGNDDFKRKAKKFGWIGNGSFTNPYLIEYYDLSMPPTKKGKKFQLPSAISIKNTDVYFKIQNNTLTSADGNYIGITLSNVEHGSIIANDITNFAIGIYIDGCTDIFISDNDIIGFSGIINSSSLQNIKLKIEGTASISFGIFLNPSNNTTISDNRILDCTNSSVYLEESTNNTIISNTINGANDSLGIYLNRSNENTITDNTIHGYTNPISPSLGVKYSVAGVAGTASISFGIFLNPSDKNIISNNWISDFTDSGVYLEGSANNELISNNINNNIGSNGSRGIYLNGSYENNITNNDIYDTSSLTSSSSGVKYSVAGVAGTASISFGIFLNPSGKNIISNNRISDFTGSGMYLEESADNALISNTISGANDSRGIYLNGSTGNIITDNTIQGSTNPISPSPGVKYSVAGVAGTASISFGIFLNPSDKNIISNNWISDFTDSGVYLEGSTNNELIGNDINNNNGINGSSGVYLNGSNGNTITDNDIYGAYNSATASPSVMYKVTGTASISFGIFLNPSHYNTISNNRVTNNAGSGLHLQGSNGNIVTENEIIGNGEYGINLEDSDTTSIANNVIYDDDLYGINLDEGSSDNSVNDNDVIGNNIGGTSQLSDDGTENQFINNFLVDHDNTDADGNGYSDKSYPIDGYADNYDSNPNALPVQDLTGIEFADLEAEVDWESETLNLKNLGNFETVKIKLPEGYSVTNIDVSTVKTDGNISAEEEAQVQNARTLIVKFNRTAIIEHLLSLNLSPFPYIIQLNVTGYLNGDFMMFYGYDNVTLIHGEPNDPVVAIVQDEGPILHPTQAFINQVVDITMVGVTQIYSGLTGSILLFSMISIVIIRKSYRKRRI